MSLYRAKELSQSNPDVNDSSIFPSWRQQTNQSHFDGPSKLRTRTSTATRARPLSASLEQLELFNNAGKEQLRMPDDPTSADAEWKRIQQNTFTRWCNEHLKCVNQYIYSLETDLCDGLKLISLLQILAHKKIARFNKKPNFKSQKLENVSIALKFVEDENIKLVNIDASDIVKGNLKLILGLIWTLILKYQISIPMMDDEDEHSNVTPKQALMNWAHSKLPAELKVNNFSSDWNNGIALASLVDSSAPGLFPDWEDLEPKNSLQNAKEAMKLAEDWLGVPQVITPEEITNPKVDELSVMTYVSYFPDCKLKPGAPLKPKLNAASKCKAYGPGLEPEGVVVNVPADFTIVTPGSSKGKMDVRVYGPGRKLIDCTVQDNHDHTYACQYIAPKQGTYDVHIRVGGHHIPNSPFRVKVTSGLDASKVTAKGYGLQPEGVVVQRPAPFQIIAKGSDRQDMTIDVIDPKGGKKTELKIEDKGNGEYHCSYMPLSVGKYIINIKIDGAEVARSPYHINVSSAASLVKIFGPGLEGGLKTGKSTYFTVDAGNAGAGSLAVFIEGPGKDNVTCNIKDNGDGTFTCTYKPLRAGTYIIKVTYDKADVPKSPIKVAVTASADLSRIKAYGPGLEKGVTGQPAEFFVEAKGASISSLTFAVEGPAEAKVEVADRGDQTCAVQYFPTAPGDYTIHVMYDEVDIPSGPFKAKIAPPGDASKCYAEGPGLKPGCMTGRPAQFTVHTKTAGAGTVEVTCVDEDGNPAEVKIKENKDLTYSVSYMPLRPGKYTVTIKFAGKNIKDSPVHVQIKPFCDASLVKANGPGLKSGKANKPCQFKIDASQAGEGGIGLTVEGPCESEIKCDDHGDGTCDVTYLPVEDGDYNINITFADEPIPGSPFKAVVSSDFDASKVKVSGPGIKAGCKAGKPCDIDIDATKAGKAKLVVEVVDEVGTPVKVDMDEEEPGLFGCTYYPKEPGKYKANVTYGGKPVPKSPFAVVIESGCDPSKVKVSGPGVEPTGIKSHEPTRFEVDASKAGEGNLDVNIEPKGRNMPKVSEIDVKEGKKPSTYEVAYVPPKHGPYEIDVKFAGEHVPKSPFKIDVAPGVDVSKCKASGPGIEEPIIGQECPINVECAPDAGDAELTAVVESPSRKTEKVKVKDNGDRTYDIDWIPRETGKHKITIKYGDKEIPKSPFYVNVVPKGEASKVKAYGPGLEKATVHKPAEFTIETKNAGAGSLGLAIEGPSEAKITCKDNGDGTCAVKYTPVEAGDYDILVRFADDHIPGSPFSVKASHPVDPSKVKCSGPGLEKDVPACAPAEFLVDCKKAGDAPLEVEVVGPDRKKRKPKIVDNKDDTYSVCYEPLVAGRHSIDVKYGGEPVPRSPFRVNSQPEGDASKCKVLGPITRPNLGYPSEFAVDTKEAGPGHLKVVPRNPADEELPVTMEDVGDGVFACAYTPEELGPHNVDVMYGGKPVPGSPFKANVEKPPKVDKIQVPEEVFAAPCLEQPLECLVDTTKSSPRDLPKDGVVTATITTPSGKKEPADVKDNRDGTFQLNYVPCEVGVYRLDIKYDSVPVPGSPFTFEVTEGGPDKVKVYGRGIKTGIAGRPAKFTVETKNAGPGGLSVSIEGPSESDINCVDNGDGTCGVTYVPLEPGNYDVHVKFADKEVPESPFKPHIVEEEPVFEVEHPCKLEMAPKDFAPRDVPSLKGVLTAPSGKQEPVKITEGPNDSFIATFTPKEYGKNMLDIKKRSNPIKGSPFPIYVREKPVLGQPCHVPFECADVERPDDVPKLKGTVVRPTGKEEPLDVEVDKDGGIAVAFVPKEVGKHVINITKEGKHVEDSPYIVMVEATPGEVPVAGKPCDINLDIPGVKLPNDLSHLKATVKRPNGQVDPLECKVSPEKTLSLSFIPYEAGEHLISVKKDKKHVPNSPFSIFVVDAPKVGSELCNKFDVPGLQLPEDLKDIEAILTTPSGKKKPIDASEGPNETLSIDFVPEEPGRHLIDVTKKGKPVKGSPFEVIVEEAVPVEGAPAVGNPCDMNFDIPELDLPKDLKSLEAVLSRPSGKKEPIDASEGPDGTLALAFTPEEPGKHIIDVKKRGKPVSGSPFEVMVSEDAPKEKLPTVGNPCDVNLAIPGVDLPGDLRDLKGKLTRPTGKSEDLPLKATPENTLSVLFVPTEPGEHIIDITKRGRPVQGSPFSVMVGDAIPQEKLPQVGSECGVNLDVPGVNLPDDLKHLTGKLERPNGKEEPLEIKANPDNTLNASFVPKEPGKHLLHINKRNRPISGSPFVVMVEDAIPQEKLPQVGSECGVNLDVPGVNLPDDLKHLTGKLERPNGKEEPLEIKANPDNTLNASFVPKEPGKHLLHINKRNRPISGSPFVVMVEDAIPQEKLPQVGSECGVNLDVPGVNLPDDLKHLTGKLERPNGKEEPLEIKANPDNTLNASFVPKEPGKHLLHINKRNRPISGSPFVVVVEDAIPQDKVPHVGSECDVNLDIPNLNLPDDLKHLDGKLERPNGKKEPLDVKANPDNTLAVSFVPKEPGKHFIHINKRNRPVAGSPFEVMVEPEQQLPGVGRPCDVTVDIPGLNLPSDLKRLKGTLERPNKEKEPVKLACTDDNKLAISFVPKEPGKHLVHIDKDGRPIPRSPIEVMVGDSKPKSCDVGLEIPGIKIPDDLRFMTGNIKAPSGKEKPVDLLPGKDNKSLLVSFIPEEVGSHMLSIKKNRRHVGDSPYEIIVKPEDVVGGAPDASKVKAYGKGLHEGIVNKTCRFDVDTREAGYGGLGLSVEGPSKVELNCVDNEDGTCSVDFCPNTPGKYTMNVTFADDHVPGSPFTCAVKGADGVVPIEEDMICASSEREVESAPPDSYSDILAFPSSQGQPSQQDFAFKFDGSKDLKATITRPSGAEDKAEIVETGSDTFTVRFVPKERGEHLVNVKSKARHIPGSPFKVLVEAPAGGAAACKAEGPGLSRGIAGQPAQFKVITRDAGPGGLAVAVEGPAKAEIQCHDNGDGSCDITWYPVEAGEYTVHIRFADEAIPGSPFNVTVQPPDESGAMSMAQFQEQILRVGQQASFAVQMKGKKGDITASVVSPSGQELDCAVRELEDQGNFAVRFVPRELGVHHVNVFFNGRHIPGSPFTVKVGGLEGDPNKVKAYGPGLSVAVVNKSAEFTVNALEAGSGALALSIDGPAKVKMNCVEQDDGTYLVTYKPTVAGSYEITIKFAGQHIASSPFKVMVFQSEDQVDASYLPGDASKCTSRGSGLRRAYVNKPAEFSVNASNAGRGSLMVGVEGPVIPVKEIVVRHTGNNIYSVNYVLEESGEYILKVLWADNHIPGSPFHVTV